METKKVDLSKETILREFATLSLEAQHQVADFIAFLRMRYEKQDEVFRPEQSDLADEPFIGIWKDRHDMQDSREWVRRVREREWLGVSE